MRFWRVLSRAFQPWDRPNGWPCRNRRRPRLTIPRPRRRSSWAGPCTSIRAIAACERTLITPNSPYDRYVMGERDALSEQQVKDIVAFLGALTGEFPEQSLPRLPGTPGFTVIR